MSDLSQEELDEGMIAVLLERVNRRIPNLLAVKERLEGGDTLSGVEIEELGSMIEGAEHSRDLIERHPEYQELVARMASLYEDIIELAVANEEKAGKN
jgi:CII-binding regulator of phage lambda lysogenization HflD